ncbi:MAG: hypothetical protein QOE29_1062 [Gaiellaceae bacterium]|jgi:uncharacterized cupin superfamily protein|nr:hypothetical protein [Gaiellaceae bacterium]
MLGPIAGFTISSEDELERSGRWALVRKSLGISSFGINVVEIAPGQGIPEHNEAERDHEELFVVLEGDLVAVIDGERHPVGARSYVRVDPEPSRTFLNEGDTVARLLIVSAPRSSGYEPLSWA